MLLASDLFGSKRMILPFENRRRVTLGVGITEEDIRCTNGADDERARSDLAALADKLKWREAAQIVCDGSDLAALARVQKH